MGDEGGGGGGSGRAEMRKERCKPTCCSRGKQMTITMTMTMLVMAVLVKGACAGQGELWRCWWERARWCSSRCTSRCMSIDACSALASGALGTPCPALRPAQGASKRWRPPDRTRGQTYWRQVQDERRVSQRIKWPLGGGLGRKGRG